MVKGLRIIFIIRLIESRKAAGFLMFNKIKNAILFLTLITAVSCTTIYRNHGYTPSNELLSKLVIGIDTRASIEATLGRPTTEGLPEGNSIYFVSSRWSHYGLKTPEPMYRQIVAIKFDSSDILRNVSRYELSDGKVVVLSRRVTAGGANEISIIKQIMGSFGRMDARDILGAP